MRCSGVANYLLSEGGVYCDTSFNGEFIVP